MKAFSSHTDFKVADYLLAGNSTKKPYWTNKRIIFFIMIIYTVAVTISIPVVIARLFFK